MEQQPSIDITRIDAERGFFAEFELPSKDQWKQEAIAALKGAPFDKVMYASTYEGFKIAPYYTAEDIEGLPHLNSKPGFEPFVRGVRASGYIRDPWRICQELTLALPHDFNEEARHDIERGQTGLTVVLDRATRCGLDPAAASDQLVGVGGVSVATLGDVSACFRNIDLNKVTVLCYAGASALPILAMLVAALREQDAGSDQIFGAGACVGADPLGALAEHGQLPVSLATAYDGMAQTTAWGARMAPRLQTVFVQGHPYHDAGASSTEEVAFALATAAEYLRQMARRGLEVETVAPRIRFGLSLGSNFFVEIAKVRAARMLWAQLVAAFGGSLEAQRMVIHGRTSAFNKTVFDPYVNMLRVTSEGFAGAIGGVDSMHTAPFDEPIRTPDRFSRRIARNVQVILQEESRFTMPIDMGAGSYAIERFTHEFGQAAWGIFQDIESAGGMADALAQGLPQAMAAATAAKRSKAVETRSDVILGTNMYPNLSEKPMTAPLVDRAALKRGREADVAQFRRAAGLHTRGLNLGDFQTALASCSSGAVDFAVEAVASGATMGELFRTMAERDAARSVATPLRIARLAESFERLRQSVEATFAATGRRVRVFLANMGPVPQHKPRADFSRGFFAVAGFDVVGTDGFETADAAAVAALASGAPVIVICSTDATYPDQVPLLARRIRAESPDSTIIVAGRQSQEATASFDAAGVDEYIHVRANCLELNQRLHERYVGQ